MALYKDLALDNLAELGNVAQFVAFRPSAGGLVQSTARLADMPPNNDFPDIPTAIESLLAASSERRINIRSYLPDDPRSREFVYGIASVRDALDELARLSAEGLHLIVNETIDIADGGVSGVAHGVVIEFAPDDTPRAVEKPDIASLPRELGLAVLRTVYGFVPDLPRDEAARVEFSIHPGPRGWRRTRTLLWEIEASPASRTAPVPHWPNRFSRHIGDKAFGLIVADQLGMPVPSSTAIARRVAPFSFGQATGALDNWLRTCPREPQPGRFTTLHGWSDPFALLAREDHDEEIASVLVQAGVPAFWSGAAIVGSDGELIVEGRRGSGDLFMLGTALPETLPHTVVEAVTERHRCLSAHLGPVRIEWVHDGERIWIVQLHVGATGTRGTILVDGEASGWQVFDVAEGLPALRAFLEHVPEGAGVLLKGQVGVTSHIADTIRKWGRPARMAVPA